MPFFSFILYIFIVIFVSSLFILLLMSIILWIKRKKQQPVRRGGGNFVITVGDFEEESSEVQHPITLDSKDYDYIFPITTYSQENAKGKINDECCSVCLCDLSEGTLRKIILCGHVFHDECLMNWTKMNESCPNCKQKLDRSHLPKAKMIFGKFRRDNEIKKMFGREIEDLKKAKGGGDRVGVGENMDQKLKKISNNVITNKLIIPKEASLDPLPTLKLLRKLTKEDFKKMMKITTQSTKDKASELGEDRVLKLNLGKLRQRKDLRLENDQKEKIEHVLRKSSCSNRQMVEVNNLTNVGNMKFKSVGFPDRGSCLERDKELKRKSEWYKEDRFEQTRQEKRIRLKFD